MNSPLLIKPKTESEGRDGRPVNVKEISYVYGGARRRAYNNFSSLRAFLAKLEGCLT